MERGGDLALGGRVRVPEESPEEAIDNGAAQFQ